MGRRRRVVPPQPKTHGLGTRLHLFTYALYVHGGAPSDGLQTKVLTLDHDSLHASFPSSDSMPIS